MKEQLSKPTDAELEILQVLWAHGPSSVRFVNETLNASSDKEVGYTTTLKLMQIMLEKGLVSRDDKSRSHIYAADVSEEVTKQRLLEKFVDATFRGSAMKLVMQALGNHRASKEELDEIRALIERKEQEE